MTETTKDAGRRCDSCTRKRGNRCATLKKMIGAYRDCPFWTDDPEWETRAEAAIRAYARRERGQVQSG